jgi:SAM-dependent methyltransferase
MSEVHVTLPTQDGQDAAAGTHSAHSDRALVITASPTIPWYARLLQRLQHRLGRKPDAGDAARREAWASGTSWELNFWEEFLAQRKGKYRETFGERMDAVSPLQPFLEELIVEPEGQSVRILDVGAGPFTFVGRKSARWPIEIVPVDPLAGGYDLLLAKYGVVPPVRTLSVAAEDLLARFGPASFDLVCCRNALDHTLDPVRALRQMCEVVKPGASISLHHQTYEAERNKYTGMHQWNFFLDGEAFIIAGVADQVNVDALFAQRATVRNQLLEGKWLVTSITRNL